MMLRKGYVQVYTGNGKGKTTAALGLALRAAGAGLRVFIAQFIKKRRCSEHTIIHERFSREITVKQYGEGLLLKRKPALADARTAQRGLAEIRKVMESKEYDIVILDEINVAVHYNLVSLADLLDLIEKRSKHMELIITGRYAKQEVMEKADLVTDMKEIKHYREKGVKARRGIEC